MTFPAAQIRREGRVLAALLTIASSACAPLGGDLSSALGAPDTPARITVALHSGAAAAPRTVMLIAFYRTTIVQSVELARTTTTIESGTVTLPLTVDIAPCLNDAAAPRANGACLLLVAIAVRDELGVLVDSTAVGPITARPGEAASAPTATFTKPASITLGSISNLGLGVGDTIRLSPTLRDASGGVLPSGGVHWSSNNTVVSVDSVLGRVTALRNGLAYVRAERSGRVDSIRVGVVSAATNEACRGPYRLLPSPVTKDTTIGGVGQVVRALLSSITVNTGGILRIAPGTTFCLDGGFLNGERGGMIQAVGTSAQPIRFLGVDTIRGWGGVTLTSAPLDSSRFAFAAFRNAIRSRYGVIAQLAYPDENTRHPVRIEDVVIGPTLSRALLLRPGNGIGIGLVRRVTVESAADSVFDQPRGNAAVVLGDSVVAEDLVILRSGASGIAFSTFSPNTAQGTTLRNVTINRATGSGLTVVTGARYPRAVGLRITGGAGYPVDLPALALGILPTDSAGYAALRGNARDTIRVSGGALSAGDTIVAAGPMPWRVDTTVSIPTNSLLRLTNGTRWAFAPIAGITSTGGSLQIAGAPSAPVTLTARDTSVGWTGITAGNSREMSIDRAVIAYTRAVPGIAPSIQSISRITRSVFRRFNAPMVSSQAIGVVIEDSRFERPQNTGGFGIVAAVVSAGTIFELRRSILNGGNARLLGVQFQSGPAGLANRIVFDSVTIDSVGLRGISFSQSTISAAVVTLRAVNLLRIGQQALLWQPSSAINAAGIWWGNTAGPRPATAFGDSTSGSYWNPALVTVLPVATAPYVFSEPPRAPSALVEPGSASVPMARGSRLIQLGRSPH